MYKSIINNILQNSLIGSNIIILIIILRKSIFKKYTKTFLYYLWITAILKMLILFRISIFISNKIYNKSIKFPSIINNSTSVLYNNSKSNIYEIVFYIWLIGLLVFFIYHAYSYLSFYNKIKISAYSITDSKIIKLYSKILYELNIKSKIPLKYCKRISSPFGIGIFKPIILIPEHTTYEFKELELILKHELIHFKRYDLYYKILIMIIMAIHWFNPLVYIMWRQINYDCELSCDEILLKNSNIELRKLYAIIFIKSLKSNKNNINNVEMITGFNNNKEILKRRLDNMISLQIRKKGLILGFLVGIISVTFFFNIKTFAQNNEMRIKPTVSSRKTKDEESIDTTKHVDNQNQSPSDPRVIYKGPIKDVPKEFAQIKSIQDQIKENPDKYIILQSK